MANVIVILAISGLIVTGFIIAGLFIAIERDPEPKDPIQAAIEKVQNKCKEYVDLACSFAANQESRIMNGTMAPRGMFPHQVHLRWRNIENSSLPFGCGGSIISERFVLTSARCIQNLRFSNGTVLIGTLDTEETNTTLYRKVKKTYKYPEYDATPSAGNDVGLVELEENLKFNSDVRPICLNTKLDKDYNYDSMIAIGWGSNEHKETSRYLMMADLQIDVRSDQVCKAVIEQLALKKTICLTHPTQGAGPLTQGDSGGSLQVRKPSKCENTWEQIGITSGKLNVTRYNLTFFGRVDNNLPWIANIVWSN